MSENKRTLEQNYNELRIKNTKLQYQFDYLVQHVDAQSLPPAEGTLRKLQLNTIDFAKELLEILKSYDLEPFLLYGALVGYQRHNKGFVPWDDDLDFGLMGKEFWRLIDIMREDFILLEASNVHILSILDNALHEYPNKIIAFQTPNCLHIYKGTSLENHVNVEFIPYYYWNESATTEDFLYHAKDINAKKAQAKSWNEILSLYKQEFATNPLYCEHSNKMASGVGSYTLTNWKFTNFYTKEQFFPLQNILFENVELPTINNIDHHLKSTYGNYMQLPRDIGITATSSVIHSYLQTQGRKLDMLEASVTCKHNG